MTSIFRTTSLRSAAGEQYPAECRALIHQPFRDSNFRPVPWPDVFLFISFHLRATRHFNEWPGVRLAVLLVRKQSWGIMVLDDLFSIYSLAGYHRRSQCLTSCIVSSLVSVCFLRALALMACWRHHITSIYARTIRWIYAIRNGWWQVTETSLWRYHECTSLDCWKMYFRPLKLLIDTDSWLARWKSIT